MNISIPIAVLIILLLTPQFICWENYRAEFTSVFRKRLPLILIVCANWIISPLMGFLSANIFFPENVFYRIGVSLLFLGPSISMVLYWNKIAAGCKSLVISATLINTFLIITLYPLLAYFLISRAGAFIPLENMFFTILLFFLTPLVLGLILQYIFKSRAHNCLSNRVYSATDKISLISFFMFLVVLYIIQSRLIISKPLEFVILSIPVLFGYLLVFFIILVLSFLGRLSYEEAASACIIGTGNQYELAIAASIIIFGVGSSVFFVVSIGPLLEAPVMIIIIRLLKTYKMHFLRDRKTEYVKNNVVS
ncbi:MAG: bile acid:sodium symporter [Candidatus Odinarchaeum yellowstonii]|uniref:Bile acid:sodium symporter n=1 Tax=Odinarchaeota yellowstonii (strain LCB_4) TaxID=1841599 RepID=A0AAF0D2Z2_ODILC|nr:MAG: bile acid:sodium symporter [Candidatus Odinarchaeum yellowstonii]